MLQEDGLDRPQGLKQKVQPILPEKGREAYTGLVTAELDKS